MQRPSTLHVHTTERQFQTIVIDHDTFQQYSREKFQITHICVRVMVHDFLYGEDDRDRVSKLLGYRVCTHIY